MQEVRVETSFAIFGVLLVLLGVVDAAALPARRFVAARHRKATWIVVQLVLPVAGTIVYAVVVRPRLTIVGRQERSAAARAATDPGEAPWPTGA
ncbi:MAG TPA: hypothetical protein VHF25_15095 [Nitriliruptorales bacterium]|nr:hypothetical protein [Nitriliruptorales bacterium]